MLKETSLTHTLTSYASQKRSTIVTMNFFHVLQTIPVHLKHPLKKTLDLLKLTRSQRKYITVKAKHVSQIPRLWGFYCIINGP